MCTDLGCVATFWALTLTGVLLREKLRKNKKLRYRRPVRLVKSERCTIVEGTKVVGGLCPTSPGMKKGHFFDDFLKTRDGVKVVTETGRKKRKSGRGCRGGGRKVRHEARRDAAARLLLSGLVLTQPQSAGGSLALATDRSKDIERVPPPSRNHLSSLLSRRRPDEPVLNESEEWANTVQENVLYRHATDEAPVTIVRTTTAPLLQARRGTLWARGRGDGEVRRRRVERLAGPRILDSDVDQSQVASSSRFDAFRSDEVVTMSESRRQFLGLNSPTDRQLLANVNRQRQVAAVKASRKKQNRK